MTKRGILLEALRSTPKDIERLVRPVDRAGDDGTVRAIVGYLIRAEGRYAEWIARAMAEDEAVLSSAGWDEAFDEAFTLQALAGQFKDGRMRTLALLTALSPGDWQRRVVLDGRRTTVRFLVQGIVEHDIEQTNRLVDAVHTHRSAAKRRAAEAERE